MKTLKLTIPSRIVYAPNTSYGTDPVGGYTIDGEKVRACLFPECDGTSYEVVCSYFKNKRYDSHHSAVSHCQVLTPPTVMHNMHTCHRYLNRSGTDLYRTALGSNLTYRLIANGEEFLTARPTDEWTSRRWRRSYSYARRMYVEEQQEFASTLTYDRWGLSGRWFWYPARDCRVRAVITDESGTVTSMGGVFFTANLVVYPSAHAVENRDTLLDFLGRIKEFHEHGVIGERISDSKPYIGSFYASWKSWTMKPTTPAIYNFVPFPEGTSGVWPDLDLRSSFRLGEPSWFLKPGRKNLVHLDLDQAMKVKQLQSEAFLNAAEDIAVMNQNTFQTLGELLGILKAVANGEYSNLTDLLEQLPQHWNDAWLMYRYSYSTNKMDIEEFIHFVQRTQGSNLLGTMSIKGSAEIDGITCHCQAVLESRNVSKIQKALYLLDRYGLCPDFYIVWDSIPYSFMVDWLVPIGDMVSRTDAQVRYSKLNYTLKYLSYSLTYSAEARLTDEQKLAYGPLLVKCYTRWQENSVPNLAWYYGDYSPTTNKWTWVKRGLDFVSIFFGRK